MFKFNGRANIYLEGTEALEFRLNGNGLVYSVGAPESNITIHDFRQLPGIVAKQTLSGNSNSNFAKVFSQKAWVEVYDDELATEIIIHDDISSENSGVTLWVGTLENDLMSVRHSFWEQIRFLNSNRIAFAALLDD